MEIGKNNVGENQYYTTMNNVTKTIDTHDKQKDLGVTFDSKLTFDEHISQVVNKATKNSIVSSGMQYNFEGSPELACASHGVYVGILRTALARQLTGHLGKIRLPS